MMRLATAARRRAEATRDGAGGSGADAVAEVGADPVADARAAARAPVRPRLWASAHPDEEALPPPAAPILEVRDLTVRHGETTAVDRACLAIADGGITALLGQSGCGKTSLLRAIAGFGEIVGGTVRVDGRLVAGEGQWVAPDQRRVGMVFQEGALFPHLTVGENVRYGLRGDRERDSKATAALDLVGMAGLEDRYPDQLSGGQQQRVALARALAPAPRLIVLDEPFANLDASLRVRVREEVREILREAGATAVLVTHDQEEALSIADCVAVMENGRILQIDTPEGVYHRPATVEVARFVGDAQLLPCRIFGGRVLSPFGTIPTDAPDGEGLLLLRPEDLRLGPASAPALAEPSRTAASDASEGGGISGVVAQRRFFGHDLLDDVLLDAVADAGPTAGAGAAGGKPAGARTRVLVRSLASAAPRVGSRVRLSLRPQTYRLFL